MHEYCLWLNSLLYMTGRKVGKEVLVGVKCEDIAQDLQRCDKYRSPEKSKCADTSSRDPYWGSVGAGTKALAVMHSPLGSRHSSPQTLHMSRQSLAGPYQHKICCNQES